MFMGTASFEIAGGSPPLVKSVVPKGCVMKGLKEKDKDILHHVRSK